MGLSNMNRSKLYDKFDPSCHEFLPISIYEYDRIDNGQKKYCICMIGINFKGNKIAVIITDIRPYYVLFRSAEADKFVKQYSLIVEYINCVGFDGYAKPVNNYKVMFDTIVDRSASLNAACGLSLKTGDNNKSNYYYMWFGEVDLPPTDWLILNKPIMIDPAKEGLANVDACYKVHYKHIERKKYGFDQAYIKPNYLLCFWDIEVLGENDYQVSATNNKDELIMISVGFIKGHKPLKDIVPDYQVNISTLGTLKPNPAIKYIHCKNERDMLVEFFKLLLNMHPDIMFGFNDYVYDWPFILNKVNQYGLVSMFSSISINRLYAPKDITSCSQSVNIKIEAGTSTEVKVPKVIGIVFVDMRVMLRRIYPKETKSSLNHFLSKAGFKNKLDIEYIKINKIASLYRHIYINSSKQDVAEMLQNLERLAVNHPDNTGVAGILQKTLTLKYAARLEKCTYKHMVELMSDISLIHDYCDYDALSCYLLMIKSSVLNDVREFGALTYTDFKCGVLNAGGIKVRNLVQAKAKTHEPRISVNTISSPNQNEKEKYPGAIVFEPIMCNYKFDKLTMLMRILNKATKTTTNVNYSQVNPRSENFNTRLLEYALDDTNEKIFNDYPELDKHKILDDPNTDIRSPHRPFSSLDFASLYPNEDIINNLSLDKLVTIEQKLTMPAGTKFKEAIFEYEGKEIHACFIDNWLDNGQLVNVGLYPRILIELFNLRATYKLQAKHIYGKKELLESLDINNSDQQIIDLFTAKQITSNDYNRLDELWKQINIEKADQSFKSYYDDLTFKYNYLDIKQKALKVFMNTFYGEAGNTNSPLFRVEVSGAITYFGRKHIQMVRQKVIDMGLSVIYGDTDSLYLRSNHELFKELDLQYYKGHISKQEYWSDMIRMTMKDMDRVRNEVNKFLQQQNDGKKFLMMDYEEVLYAFMLVGKKMYGGIKHVNEVNTTVWNAKNIDEFRKYEVSVLYKGLDFTKRQASKLLIESSTELIRQVFNIESCDTVTEISMSIIKSIAGTDYDVEYYAKSARYVPPSANHLNIPKYKYTFQQVIVQRAIDVRNKYQDIGVYVPEPGERFNYVVCNKPIKLDHKGCKIKLRTCDMCEIQENLKNPKYLKYLEEMGEPYIPNKRYYVANEILKQFARLMCTEYKSLFGVEPDSARDASPDVSKYITSKIKHLFPVDTSMDQQSKLIKRQYKQERKALNLKIGTNVDLYSANTKRGIYDNVLKQIACPKTYIKLDRKDFAMTDDELINHCNTAINIHKQNIKHINHNIYSMIDMYMLAKKDLNDPKNGHVIVEFNKQVIICEAEYKSLAGYRDLLSSINK
jgi:DNA polymerase elongation subunit (family B)